MPDFLPKISIVTPSYNQGIYIEQTILSVIGQGYENLEYIILDGGSTDATVEIIKKYEKYITYWKSEKDNGQSAAINDGFAMATGDILYWLCSDDMLIPGTLLKIGSMFKDITDPTVVIGNCINFHQTKATKTRGSDVVSLHATDKLSLHNYIYQPSAFWNRAAWDKTGILNLKLNYSMDWDWFLRAEIAGVKFIAINDYLSLFRWHDNHKTGVKGKDNPRDVELVTLYGTYNSDKIKKAFAHLRKKRNSSKFINDVIYASNLYDINPLKRVLHLLLCPTIQYKEYVSITHM